MTMAETETTTALPADRDPRSFLGACLVRLGYDHDKAEELVQAALDREATELAEKIRAGKGTYYPTSRLGGDGWIADAAADLIDPAVTK
jgi:hypothetical protein